MADKEFKSLKEYIIKNYKYYKLELEPLIFGQLKVAKNKRNLTYYNIEMCLRYIFDCEKNILEPNFLAWGIYNYYVKFIEREKRCIEFCTNKYISEIDEEIKNNKKLTKFDIYILNKQKIILVKNNNDINLKNLPNAKIEVINIFNENENVLRIIDNTDKVDEIVSLINEYSDYKEFVDKVNKIIKEMNFTQ